MTRWFLYFYTMELSKLKIKLELICTFIGKYLSPLNSLFAVNFHFKLVVVLVLVFTTVNNDSRFLCFVFSRNRPMTESPRRPLMNEWSKTGYRSYTSPSDRLSKRLGASLPNLEQPVNDTMIPVVFSHRTASLQKMSPDFGQCGGSDLEVITKSFFNLIYHFPGLKLPQKPIKVFRLPDFPPPLAYHYVQNYYSDMVASLGKAISTTPPEESALLARYYTGKKQEINCL